MTFLYHIFALMFSVEKEFNLARFDFYVLLYILLHIFK